MICTSSGRAGSERAAIKTAADTIIANENVRSAERGRCSRASLDIGRPLGSPTILKTLSGHVMEDHSARRSWTRDSLFSGVSCPHCQTPLPRPAQAQRPGGLQAPVERAALWMRVRGLLGLGGPRG